SGDSGTLEADHLGLAISNSSSNASGTASTSPDNIAAESDLSKLAEIEKRHILAVLDRCNGNRTQAAKLLDISIRTLRNKLHEYNGTSPKGDSEEETVSES